MSTESTLIATQYNRLLMVNDADQELKRHGRDAALAALCSVITNYGLQPHLGVAFFTSTMILKTVKSW